MKKAVLLLEPVTCPTCVKQIETSVEDINGVESVDVLFHNNRVRVTYDQALATSGTIKEAIEQRGFPVASVRES